MDDFLDIERFSQDGDGVGFLQEPRCRVDVAGAIPGERVLVEFGKKRRGKYQGALKEVLQPSPDRTTPRCPHAGSCGGCVWQHVDYAAQLKEKQKRVEALFEGHPVNPIIGCADPWRYRNKMEFTFSQDREGRRFAGLIMRNGRGKVLNVTDCQLASPWFMEVLQEVRGWWEKSGLEAYHLPSDRGSLRTLTLREGKRTGEKMVMLTVSGNTDYVLKAKHLEDFLAAVKRASGPDVLSVFLRVQQIAKGMPTQFYELRLYGPDHINEELEVLGRRLKFKISPTSFFQPNTFQAEVLYSTALKMVQPKGLVYDLYCGTATIGMALALQAERVIGIELNPHATFDAESNKETNGIENLEIKCGDVGKVLKTLKWEPHLVVVDPPRAGLDGEALNHVCGCRPKEILYISCNPKTQTENVKIFLEQGYKAVQIQPVDQFPHTLHIENIVHLESS